MFYFDIVNYMPVEDQWVWNTLLRYTIFTDFMVSIGQTIIKLVWYRRGNQTEVYWCPHQLFKILTTTLSRTHSYKFLTSCLHSFESIDHELMTDYTAYNCVLKEYIASPWTHLLTSARCRYWPILLRYIVLKIGHANISNGKW